MNSRLLSAAAASAGGRIPFDGAGRSPRVALIALGLLALIGTAASVRAEDDLHYLLRLQGDSFVPPAGNYASGLAYLREHAGDARVHLLVQTNAVPSSNARLDLASQGMVLQGYLPERAYYASVSTSLDADAIAAMDIRWFAPLSFEQKVDARVRNAEFGPWSEYPGGLRILAVQFHDDIDTDAARALLAERGVVGDWIASTHTGIVALDPNRLTDLAALDQVKYVAELPPPLTGVNDSARQSIGVNTVQAAPYGLNGLGSNVLIYDVGLVDKNHADFSTNRVTWGESGSVAQHSTHCGGSVGGNGTNSGGTYKGMAPETKITSYLYESCSPNCLYNSPQDIEDNYHEGIFSYGAQLSSNSLGSNIANNGYPCSWEGDYEITAQLLDAIAGGSLGAPFLSLWAAGNERAYSRCGTTYSTTGAPAASKNAIVVGATNSNDHSMTYFSSWGPVDDGRLRPDISAPGCQTGGDGGITSTSPGQGYASLCGTSMATPITAGTVALLRQQMRRTPGLPLAPLPSTIKAILIQTAQDYGNVGPDYQFGYGEIRAIAMVDHVRNRNLLVESIVDNAEEVVLRVDVPEGLGELKASLAWDDVPGQLLASRELVNDLDLVIESPAGVLSQAWVLNPASPNSAATRGSNRLDTTEQVVVANPESGTWKIHVQGFAVPSGPQRFSVVANAQAAPNVGVEDARSSLAKVSEVTSSPNPMANRSTLSFRLATDGAVKVEIMDASGRRVRSLANGWQSAGLHFLNWNGQDDRGDALPRGLYFYRVQSGAGEATTKVLLLP